MKNFTLIEAMIVIAIVGVFASMIHGFATDGTVCRGGYKFVADRYGYTQVFDKHGHGITCGS